MNEKIIDGTKVFLLVYIIFAFIAFDIYWFFDQKEISDELPMNRRGLLSMARFLYLLISIIGACIYIDNKKYEKRDLI